MREVLSSKWDEMRCSLSYKEKQKGGHFDLSLHFLLAILSELQTPSLLKNYLLVPNLDS